MLAWNPMQRGRLLALAFLLVSTDSPAESKLEPPDLSRYLRWRPLRARPGLELSNVGYDDNIFFREQEKTSDYTATLTPKLDGLILFGSRAFLVFTERLDYTLYLKNTDQNYLNQRGTARLTFPFRRLGLFTDLGLSNIKERQVDRQDIRPERREARLGFGILLRPGWRTEIEVSQSTTDWRYVDPDFEGESSSIGDRLDRTTSTTLLKAAYRLLGRTELTLDGYTRTHDFDNLFPSGDLLIDRDSRERSVQPGLAFGEGGALTGSIRVGWAEIDATDPVQPDLSAWVGRIELAYRPNSRWILRSDGERTPGFSAFEENTYFLNTAFGLRGVYYWSRVFGVESGGSLGRLTFPESMTGAVREDRLRRYDLGMRMRLAENSLGRRVEYSLRVGRYRRESTLPEVEHSQTTFGLNAVVGF